VVYGDASDPELFDHLPLADVIWVISTAPDIETNRVLLQHLRARGFDGKIAVACRTADEGDLLRLEGADVLLRPYADAAPARNTSGIESKWAGHRIAEIPLREEFGATVLAVSRGGRSFFNPGPTFQLFPSDRVFLSGDPSVLDRAIDYLAMVDAAGEQQDQQRFGVEEIRVGSLPGWTGRSLAALELPARFGVIVLAVARGHDQLSAPDPQQPLSEHDRLVLAGTPEDLQHVRAASDGAESVAACSLNWYQVWIDEAGVMCSRRVFLPTTGGRRTPCARGAAARIGVQSEQRRYRQPCLRARARRAPPSTSAGALGPSRGLRRTPPGQAHLR
jgi:Trk K+ transport system NAD-binding subunit